jgi:BON domain
MDRALRRAGRVLVAAVALGLARPALASPDSTLSAPTRQPAAQAGQRSLSPAQMRWLEIQVELAWLADSSTCPCPLKVQVQNGQILIEGTAPSEPARARALQLARQFGVIPLRDGIRIQPNPEEAPAAGANAPLQAAALTLLNKRMGPRAASLEVGALENGLLYIGGSVTSFQEKLSISRLLKQVPGCQAVRNDLQVTVVPFEGRNYQRVTRDGKLAVDASTSATASTVQPIRSTVQTVLTPANAAYSVKTDVSSAVRMKSEPVQAVLTTTPAGSLSTSPTVRKPAEPASVAPVNVVPETPGVSPPAKTTAEPTPVTEPSASLNKLKTYTPQWSTIETWDRTPAKEPAPPQVPSSTAPSTPTQMPPSAPLSSVPEPVVAVPEPVVATPAAPASPYHSGTSRSTTPASLPKVSAPLTTAASPMPNKLSPSVEEGVTRTTLIGKTSAENTGKDDKPAAGNVSTTVQNPTPPASNGSATPRLEPVPEGTTASTPEGPRQRPLGGLLTHLFPAGTPDKSSGTKVKGETTSVVLLTGKKSEEPVKVGYKPYVSNGVAYFDDETASPPTNLLGTAQTDLKKRVLAATAGKASHADVVVGQDKITTIKVTVATEAQEKEVRAKILQFPEMHSPNVCLETTVAPE